MEEYIKSPKTGRWITIRGKAYQDLLEDKKYASSAKKAKRYRKPEPGSKPKHEGKVTNPRTIRMKKAPRESLSEVLRHEPPTRRAKIAHLKAMENETKKSRTRGWGSMAPQKGKERHELMKVCGEQCFLMPGREGFPICSSLDEGKKYRCKVNCKGVNAAYIRARQWNYPKVAASALELKNRYKC